MRSARCITALLICICLVFCPVPGTFAVRTTPGTICGEFTYFPSGEYGEITEPFYYSDSYFAASGTFSSVHLRTVSAALALTASFKETAAALLTQAGFSESDLSAEDMDGEPTRDTIGSVMTHKSTIYGEVIAVVIRGSNYRKEWADNFDIGVSGDAAGFSRSARKITDRIKAYEKRYGLQGAKLWITGFSRGGAVADLTGKYIDQALSDYGITADDLYVYTFEAPAGSCERTDFANIHNVRNPNDPIPMILPGAWGFSNSGVTEMLPADEVMIYRKELSFSVTGGVGLVNRYATVPSGNIWTLPKKEISPAVSLTAFEQNFASWLSSCTDRETFSKYSRNIGDLLEVFAFRSSAENARLSALMSGVMKEMFSAKNVALVLSLTYLKPGSEKYESALEILTGTFVNALDKTGRGNVLTEDEFDSLKHSVPNVIRFALPLIKEDLAGEHSLERFGTIVGNLGTIITEHYLQNIFMLVKRTDPYYTEEGGPDDVAGEGTFYDATDALHNHLRAEIVTEDEELLDAVLTDEERREYGNGANVMIKLAAAEGSLRTADREALKNSLAVIGSGAAVGTYTSLSLSKKVGNTVRRRTDRTLAPVSIRIKLPRTLMNSDRTVIREFDVISLHGGSADILRSEFDAASGTLGFETDSFSLCVLVMRDRPAVNDDTDPNPTTGESF